MFGLRFWFDFTQRKSAFSGITLGLLIVAAGLVPRAVPADDYLDAIEGEAAKLSEEPAASKPEADATDKAPSTSDDPQARFGQELKGRYRGSYLFYQRLPVKSRKEVFDAYEQGASIKEVRRMILNRFSHSR